MMASLSHVVGLVTGGCSGLGAATAAYLVRNGGRVVVADLGHQKDNFARLAAMACAEAAKIRPFDEERPVLAFCETDVTDESQVKAALDMVEEQFGESVNTAVSCAGLAIARKTLSQKKDSNLRIPHPLDEFSKTLHVNTIGTFNVARLSAERMAREGCIINTASIAAYEGQIGQVAYAASKGAVVAMTLPMARELAPFGIRVMTIMTDLLRTLYFTTGPGLFQTPLLDGLPDAVKAELGAMVPCPSRLGDPDEFGQLVGSILTNPMLNGEVIRLDGALRMPPK